MYAEEACLRVKLHRNYQQILAEKDIEMALRPVSIGSGQPPACLALVASVPGEEAFQATDHHAEANADFRLACPLAIAVGQAGGGNLTVLAASTDGIVPIIDRSPRVSEWPMLLSHR
jgi:hypothetical protein